MMKDLQELRMKIDSNIYKRGYKVVITIHKGCKSKEKTKGWEYLQELNIKDINSTGYNKQKLFSRLPRDCSLS